MKKKENIIKSHLKYLEALINKNKLFIYSASKELFFFKKKYKIKPEKSFLCKKCKTYLVPGFNMKIRFNKGLITKTCLNCNSIYRFKIRKN